MKTKNRLSIMITLLVMIPLFISVVFAIWYISDFKMATPDNKKDNILTKYIDDQETIYDGNIQLPSPNVFENSIPLNTNDISYYFKINNSADEYVLCKENTTGPKNAGEYSVKVKYDLSYTDLTGQTITDSVEKVITFTIKKYDISSSSSISISFTEHLDNKFLYLDKPVEPTDLQIKFNENVLIENEDYQVTYEDNNSSGTAKAIITGINNFQGTVEKTFEIFRKIYLRDDYASESGNSKSVMYNGDYQYPDISAYADEDYKIKLSDVSFVYSDKPINAGSYWITVTATKEGYEDGTLSVHFDITKKPITSISWSGTQFTYDGQPHHPSPTVNGLIDDDICSANIDSSTMKTNAGNYVAKIDSLTNSNYCIDKNTINIECKYQILKAKVQGLGETITLDRDYIEGDEPSISKKANYTLYGITPSGKSQEIMTDGKISKINYSLSNFEDGQSKEQKTILLITFITENSNYEDYVYTASIDIYAVATIGSTYYGTVERALEASKSGDSVYLIPGRNPTIRNNTVIKSDVTLNIVYETGVFKDNRESDKKNIFADTNEKDYLKNTLNIAEGIILTNNGNLKIDGVVGNAGQTYAGQTSGEYTQILLDKNAKIENNNTIYCLGYIKEKSQNNKSQVNINQGKLSAPLVIYDFKGGSATNALHNKNICPFKIFDMPNVQPSLNINAGGEYEALTSLWIDSAGGHILQDGIYIIGKSRNTSALFILESGSVSIKYNYSINYIDSDMKININGNCSTGSLKLTIKMIFDIKLDTANYYCPISYKIKVSIDSGTFKITEKIEFLPGSELIVDSSGKLNIEKNCIFYESFNDTYSNYRYPSSVNGNQLPGAKFEVNGICNITSSFAGIITSNSSNAQLSIANVCVTGITDANCEAKNLGSTYTMYYGICKDSLLGEVQLQNATLYAKGYINSISSGYQNFETGSYISNGSYWEYKDPTGSFTVTYKYWDDNQNKEVEISYTHNLFDTTTEIPLTIDNSITERKFYNIDNWYVVEDGIRTENLYNTITPANGENYTIELVYTPKQYTINYNNITNENQEVFVDNKTVITYGNFDGISIYNPDDITGKSFVGWYLTNNFDLNDTPFVNPDANIINAINHMEDNNITEITLYGKYVVKHRVTIHLSTLNSIMSGESIIDKEIQIEHGSSLTASQLAFNIFDELNTNNQYAYYFAEQWTNSESSTVEFDIDSKIESDIELYPILKSKQYILTIKYIDYYDESNYLENTQYYIDKNNSDDITNEVFINNVKYKCRDKIVENESITITNNGWTFENYEPSITINCYKVVTVTFTDSGGHPSEVLLNNNKVSLNGQQLEVCQGDTLIFTSIYTENDNKVTEIENASFKTSNDDDNTYIVTIGSEDVTINISSQACIVEGTLISMADGSYKKVEDLKVGDLVLVFNHETGKIDVSPVIINDHDTEASKLITIINLVFSNGQTTRISFEHGFFDADLNKYVYINNQNYEEMIGHSFYAIDGSIVTLVDTYITEENVKVFSPVTYKHLNIFADDLLSIAGDINGLFNIFELNKNMTLNIEKFNEDIQKYGLYEYSEWCEYLTYEQFIAFNVKYLKVSVGKGLVTIDDLLRYIDEYLN